MAEAVLELAASHFPGVALEFHPQCFLKHGHFAGSDPVRAEALLEIANDPAYDAVWFARGGYGSGRLLPRIMPRLNAAAREKIWLGYSDMGSLLGALYADGFRHVAHGPMPVDIVRDGGQAAVARALGYFTDGSGVEPHCGPDVPSVAFNLVILCHLLGTPWQPDLTGHVLMLEEVSEAHYRFDRDLFQLTSTPAMRGLAGIRLGRVSQIPDNDPAFGQGEAEIVAHWCDVSGIAWLGRADIGHDSDNKVVPFGINGRRKTPAS
jgi:muramoyltetrapeptide carboxypeptidase